MKSYRLSDTRVYEPHIRARWQVRSEMASTNRALLGFLAQVSLAAYSASPRPETLNLKPKQPQKTRNPNNSKP